MKLLLSERNLQPHVLFCGFRVKKREQKGNELHDGRMMMKTGASFFPLSLPSLPSPSPPSLSYTQAKREVEKSDQEFMRKSQEGVPGERKEGDGNEIREPKGWMFVNPFSSPCLSILSFKANEARQINNSSEFSLSTPTSRHYRRGSVELE